MSTPSSVISSAPAGRFAAADLFRIFLRVGLTSFGMTMLENVRRVALTRGLLSEEELREGLAMVQLYPGPILFDLVVFIGYRRRGTAGATAAALGYMLPAMVLMLALAWLYGRYGAWPAMQVLSTGLGAAVVGVIAHIALDFAKRNLVDATSWLLALLAFAAVAVHVNVLVIIAFGLVGGWASSRDAQPLAAREVSPKNSALWGPLLVCGAVMLMAMLAVVTDGPLASVTAEFMKIGATAFGNAATILPVMQQAVVRNHAWLAAGEFNTAIALGNLTPGPVLNSATFIGYRVAGVGGGIAATLAIFAPSFAMTLLFTELFARIRHLAWVRAAVAGVLSVFVGLLASTCLLMAQPMADQPMALALGALTFALLRWTRLNLAWVFGIGVALWAVWSLVAQAVGWFP